jgi:hypothetical protein
LVWAPEIPEEIGRELAPKLPGLLGRHVDGAVIRRGRDQFRGVRDADLAENLVSDDGRRAGRLPIGRGDGGRAAYDYRLRRRSEADDFDNDDFDDDWGSSPQSPG